MWITGTSRADLNGQVGTIVAVHSDRDRVHVALQPEADAVATEPAGAGSTPAGEAAEEAAPAVAVGSDEAEVPQPKFATKVMFFQEGHEQYRPAPAGTSSWSRARGFIFTALRRDRDPQRLDVGGGRSRHGESREACGAREVLK